MSGTNVVTGIQALLDSKYVKNGASSIPSYIQNVTKESQSLLLCGDQKNSNTIVVANGEIALPGKNTHVTK
jgi:hypothetical protein